VLFRSMPLTVGGGVRSLQDIRDLLNAGADKVSIMTAAIKKEPDLAVGNILGSNAFNILSVLGIASLVRPLEVPAITLTRDMWVMLAVALLCLPVMGSWRRITRWEGGAMFLFYIGYIVVVYVHEVAS